MNSYSKEMIQREIILDHVTNPRHKEKTEKAGYQSYHMKNPACGDEVCMFIKQNETLVEDVTYEVSGCSICSASTSMISDVIFQKTKSEIYQIFENYHAMLTDHPYQETLLQDLVALEGIKKLPSRIRCATLAMHAVNAVLTGEEHDGRL